MPTTAEDIRKKQNEVATVIRDCKNNLNENNADPALRLVAMTIEAGMCAAAYEIAIQLAELNSKLDSVIGKDRDLNKRVRVF